MMDGMGWDGMGGWHSVSGTDSGAEVVLVFL